MARWIAHSSRLAIYSRDKFQCAYCGRAHNELEPGNPLSLDHLVPRDAGGGNRQSNLVTACRSCNASRGTGSWREFAGPEAAARIARLKRRSTRARAQRALEAIRALGYQGAYETLAQEARESQL